MDKAAFSQALQAARQRAGFYTRAQFVEELSRHGLVYSDEAIGHWERGRSIPERVVLLRVLRLLAEQGGISDLDTLHEILHFAGLSRLSPDEQAEAFPQFQQQNILHHVPRPDYRTLIGRDAEINTLATRLNDPSDRQIIAITGLGGIGKTALAYEVIRSASATGLYKSVVWQSLKSEEFIGTGIQRKGRQATNWQSILLTYADQLGRDELKGLSPDKLAARLADIFHSDPYLVVLDNLETSGAAQEIAVKLQQMLGDSSSRVLLTSRERLLQFSFVYDYPLQGLAEAAATLLLREEASARGADALLKLADIEPAIYETTHGMPLAIKLVVTQFLLGIPIEEALERLQSVTGEREIYEFIYFSLWQKLTLDAQKVLVGIATFGTSAQREHLMAVSDVDEQEITQATANLIRYSLIHPQYHVQLRQQRYAIHSMTRWFVNGPLADAWRQQRNG